MGVWNRCWLTELIFILFFSHMNPSNVIWLESRPFRLNFLKYGMFNVTFCSRFSSHADVAVTTLAAEILKLTGFMT